MIVCPVMSCEDVALLRLLGQAQAQSCRVVQDIKTRHFVLLPVSGGSVSLAGIEAARSWLRGYAECGRGARRCFVAGRHACSVSQEEVLNGDV
jgi:hypothetical protein